MLVLVYTTIDTLAWAIYGDEIAQVKDRFVKVCERYVLPDTSISCTALELYAARCAILHSLGWESDLSKSGKARSVFYSFGNDNPKVAQEAFNHSHPGRFIAVHADELLTAVKNAVGLVAKEATLNDALAARLAVADGKQYMTIESKESDLLYGAYLKSARGGDGP